MGAVHRHGVVRIYRNSSVERPRVPFEIGKMKDLRDDKFMDAMNR